MASLPALGASLCCSGGCLSLCLMWCGGGGLAWEEQCCVAPTLHVLALFPLIGLQLVLLQEGLPPLCSGEYQCFPSGNQAGCGEEKRCLQETFQPSLTAMHTASSCAALGWFSQGFPLGAVYLAFSELWSTWSPGNRGGGQDSGSGSSCSSRTGLYWRPGMREKEPPSVDSW